MKTLITGASGFIGRSLLRQELPGEIHTISRNPNALPRNFSNHIGDLKDKDFVKSLAKEEFDRIIHLSWEGLPDLSKDLNLINLNTSKYFLEAMANSGSKEFFVAGSCLEYGELTGKINEDAIGIRLTDFAETKLKLLEFLQSFDIDYKWLRIFFAFGPNQHEKSLLASAFRSVKESSPMEIKNPKIARDFIYIDDVARAIARLINSAPESNVFNIGSGKATSVVELVNVVYGKMGSTKKLNEGQLEDPLIANIEKIQTLTNWMPASSIDQGIEEYLKWKDSDLLA